MDIARLVAADCEDHPFNHPPAKWCKFNRADTSFQIGVDAKGNIDWVQRRWNVPLASWINDYSALQHRFAPGARWLTCPPGDVLDVIRAEYVVGAKALVMAFASTSAQHRIEFEVVESPQPPGVC
jgi:hypothetical protein